MDIGLALAVIACYAASSFLKGITGLGFSTICLGLLASFLDVKTSIALVILPSLTSNFFVMVQAGHFRATFRRFRFMFLCTFPGLLLGLWMLSGIEGAKGRLALGAVLATYGFWALASRGTARLSPRGERLLMAPAGFTTGIINGLTGSQIMPILPYLLALDLDKDGVVQAMNTSFTISSLIMLVGLGGLGVVTPWTLGVSVAGILPVALCVQLGGKIRNGMPEERFRRMVLALLIILGSSMIIRTL